MPGTKKLKWYKIAAEQSELNFGPNNLLQLNVGGKTICIAKISNEFYACSNKCPHAGGIISEGFIDPLNNIVCPLHRYKFNLQNGREVNGEGYYLKIYPIRQTNEGIYLGIEEGGITFW